MPQIDSVWAEEGDPWHGHRKSDGRLGSVAVGRASELEEWDHFDNFVARESVRFLENFASSDEPFFLISSFLKPHDPFMPARRFADMFNAEQMGISPSWGKVDLTQRPAEVREAVELCRWTPELKQVTEVRQRMASYYGCLAQMDDCVGQVLQTLKRLGLDSSTIVVYTSDHGEMLGDLGLWNKFQFYEGSCGVPLSVRLPGKAPDVCEVPVSLVSLKATLAELCSIPTLGATDGKSFAGLVQQPHTLVEHSPVFAEYGLGSSSAKYMIRDGDYKYTHWANDVAELYNLRADPQELHNLVFDKEHRQVVEELRKKLFDWHTPRQASRETT
jgi:choline-sulfatase